MDAVPLLVHAPVTPHGLRMEHLVMRLSENSTVQKELEPLDSRELAIQAYHSLFVSADIVWLGVRRTTRDKCQR
jgi:hypothetical protein